MKQLPIYKKAGNIAKNFYFLSHLRAICQPKALSLCLMYTIFLMNKAIFL